MRQSDRHPRTRAVSDRHGRQARHLSEDISRESGRSMRYMNLAVSGILLGGRVWIVRHVFWLRYGTMGSDAEGSLRRDI